MTEECKPCPFCGHRAKFYCWVDNGKEGGWKVGMSAAIKCQSCGAAGPGIFRLVEDSKAIDRERNGLAGLVTKMWNKRAE